MFATFLSTFLIEILGRLEQDPLDIIQDVLIYQTQMMRNSSLGPYTPTDFSPPAYIVVVNALFYASLGGSILSAFIAMLIRSWLREYTRALLPMLNNPEQRAKKREFRYLGMERWQLPWIIETLPLLFQMSFVFFSIGLVIFLSQISKPSTVVITVIFGVGIFFYAMTTSIAVIVPSSPFHSHLSQGLAVVYRRVHAYFCPSVQYFLSTAMDATPATTLGRLRRHIEIFFQKTRPYPENDFEEPISATTVDEVQSFIAALVLQRIHELAQHSQYGEVLEWSVWRVAGSAALRFPPLFNLPSWVNDERHDEEYFSHFPPSTLVTLLAVSLRSRIKLDLAHTDVIRRVLGPVPNTGHSWTRVVIAVCDRYERSNYRSPGGTPRTMRPDDLTRMIQWKELDSEESLWLLSTLSELFSDGWLPQDAPYLIDICLEMLSNHSPEQAYTIFSDLVLLEAVVTLAAISCSPNLDNRRNIITSSREHPFLLPNTRNPALFRNWFERTHSDCHRPLISLLFLVVNALMKRRSYPLANQYLAIITAKGDFPLWTSALTAVASTIENNDLSTIGRMLVAPVQALTPVAIRSTSYTDYTILEELLKDYDSNLLASENLDPNIIAILLVLSKHLDLFAIGRLAKLNLELSNPCLRLVARAAARLDIPDGSGLTMELCPDHRVQNMIAALSLLRYTKAGLTQYPESSLLASFLPSQEPAISSVGMEYYMKTAISYPDPPALSCHLSHSMHAVFSPMLPNHQLLMGWRVLETFANEFDNLPIELRRTFAGGFFTLSRQPRPRSQGDTGTNTNENELESILTWKYFNKEEQELEFTDSEFSGLDWMAMAWSLHLSQQSNRMREGQSGDIDAPGVNEESVLITLCKLLDAAPYYQIIPIIPKLREFIGWFDDTNLPECRLMISSRVKEAVRRHEEFEAFHRFDKFHCMLYI